MQGKRFQSRLYIGRVVAIVCIGFVAVHFASVWAEQVDRGTPEQEQDAKARPSEGATRPKAEQEEKRRDASEEALKKSLLRRICG